ncbi:hypothetical protein [Pseudosporangium ferrugineum]|uniref:CdiI immunity protein domain-containing protein n=1 Tax=Pseudosporangium ferrugineum TaxID=439699 RepID=A0A2T0RHF9_9ACTN|nr:hypothetical protein [Pseudosporangium ferrugineum]PRY20562.1 hypothetical protein CLV70_12330 [Pseudosporangium ferrugineum]
MDTSGLPEPLRARMAQVDAMPALETARDFLSGFLSDAGSLPEVRAELTELAQSNTRAHHRYLRALETLLSEPQPPGTLLQLVEGYGNWSLDHDPTDAGAAAFLADLVSMLREVVKQAERQP